MAFLPQLRIPATYMRGGTSKGVFFRLEDLPDAARVPGPARDALLMRVIGSPDPYGKHTDGMGGATSSTSKCVIISASTRPGHDVDYLYGQVSIDTPSTGTKVEIRAASSPTPAGLNDTTVLAPAFTLKPGHNVIPVRAGSPTSNLLVWISTLGTTNGKSQAGFSEITVQAAS